MWNVSHIKNSQIGTCGTYPQVVVASRELKKRKNQALDKSKLTFKNIVKFEMLQMNGRKLTTEENDRVHFDRLWEKGWEGDCFISSGEGSENEFFLSA